MTLAALLLVYFEPKVEKKYTEEKKYTAPSEESCLKWGHYMEEFVS